MAVINREQWLAEAQPKLSTSIEFLKHVRNLDAFNKGGIIHIPQAGGSPSAQISRTVFPVPVYETNDDQVIFNLVDISTDQRRVTNLDQWNASYDVRSTYLEQDLNDLKEKMARYMLDRLFASTPVIQTSGASQSDFLAPGATTARKAITYKDLTKAKAIFDKANVPATGRKLLLDSDLLNQLLEDDKISNMFYNANQFSTRNGIEHGPGVLGVLAGFEILSRSAVATFSDAGTYKPFGTATATTDRIGALAWHQAMAGASISPLDMFTQEKSPAYLADMYNFQVQLGGGKMRKDNIGVLAIIQG